ncbi:hypothetical protein ACFYWH_42575 [Streptomyces sp. NPDC003737]|uniref:hypothetical protein n=1 Tax=Streptomyces sp. NPDC003737 TaxID=3364685 RepID=UPI00368ECDC7
MRVWYWFVGTGFIVVAFFCFIAALTIWNTARTDQTYPRKPTHVAMWSGMGVVCLGLMVLFYSL